MAIDFSSDDQLPPIPPADLVYRVVPAFKAGDAEHARQSFHQYARSSVLALERGLSVLGRELTSFERILDFGCGPGRVMRHLGPLAAGSQLHGVDVDPDSIAWCAEHIGFAKFVIGPHEPPLPYADGQFDLVYNHSVFTHIDERRQDLWLAELARVLAPGGIALLTVHSTRQWNQALGYFGQAGEDVDAYKVRLARDGILFISDDAYVGSPHPEWYHSTFHAPWYVHRHWARFFTVRAYIPEGADTQDMVVLERPAAPDPLLEPIGADGARTASGSRTLDSAGSMVGSSPDGGVRRRVCRLTTAAQHGLKTLGGLDRRVAALERTTTMLRTAQYQQAELTKIVERELRAELERRKRASGPEG
ncbi:MAG: class I SAM-dependent methyltransferase [Actinomycetota bacterium]|nr:class I SAM-dependent methyltransferase [Actinomycetota bacterium]